MGTDHIFYLCVLLVGYVSPQNGNNNNPDTKLFTGNTALDSGALGFGLGVGASAVLPGLLGGLGGPCGRRKRSAQNKDGTNTKFFLGNNCNTGYNQPSYNPCGRRKRSAQNADSRFFSSNNNCGGYNSGYNTGYNTGGYNTGYNTGGYNTGGYNTGYNTGGYHNSGGGCRCTSLTIWRNGRTEGNCRTSDYGKGAWCYTTGWNQGCSDYHSSQKYPNNPWSYQACR